MTATLVADLPAMASAAGAEYLNVADDPAGFVDNREALRFALTL